MARADVPRIAVLGAGPIGLEAALYARSLALPLTVFERGRIGEHLQRWGHVRLLTPFGMNSTPLGKTAILEANPRHEFPGEPDCITGRQHFTVYLEPLAKSAELREAVPWVSRPARARHLREAREALPAMMRLPPLTPSDELALLQQKVNFGLLPASALVLPEDRVLSPWHALAVCGRGLPMTMVVSRIIGVQPCAFAASPISQNSLVLIQPTTARFSCVLLLSHSVLLASSAKLR